MNVRFLLCVAGGMVSLVPAVQAYAQGSFDPGRGAFPVSVNDEVYPYREFAISVMPQERLILRIPGQGADAYTLDAEGVRVRGTEPRRWVWNAPRASGVRELTFRRSSDSASMLLRVFVKVPADRLAAGELDGYPIGRYPPAEDRSDVYAAPNGFIEIREEYLWLPVSPHFVLGQFVSDSSEGYPKYVVLRERLILKLEALLERVNERGHFARSFAIVSGYRTPLFNESIGGTLYSRHIYGGAAGIIVDRNGDGLMDDLDGDGRAGDSDVEYLYGIADELFRQPDMEHLRGGLTVYRSMPWRGPYLHVDARGYRARWNSDADEQRLPQPIDPKHLRDFPPPGRAAFVIPHRSW